jgi:hypothetical protein
MSENNDDHSIDSTIQKSQALDQHLADSIAGIKTSDALATPALVTAEKSTMSVTGIQSGAFEAKLADMRKKLSDRLTQGLSKIDGAAEAGAAKMDAAVDGIVAKVDKEIEDKLQEFATLTNGGPA